MFRRIEAVGTDTVIRGGKRAGSVIVEGMTVGGA
jgi:hypothetical protein